MSVNTTLPIEPTELSAPQSATVEAKASRGTTSPWYYGFALPLFAAAVSLTAYQQWPSPPFVLTFPGVLLLLVIASAAYTDLRRKKIPNWITRPAMLAALAVGAAASFGSLPSWWGGLQLSSVLAGAAFCFLCMLFPYRASGGGAGDVKLAAVIGALLGWRMGLSVIVWAYLTCGVGLLIGQLLTSQPWLLVSALVRSFGARVLPEAVNAPSEGQQQLLNRPIPLGGAFAVGAICALCGGNLFGV